MRGEGSGDLLGFPEDSTICYKKLGITLTRSSSLRAPPRRLYYGLLQEVCKLETRTWLRKVSSALSPVFSCPLMTFSPLLSCSGGEGHSPERPNLDIARNITWPTCLKQTCSIGTSPVLLSLRQNSCHASMLPKAPMGHKLFRQAQEDTQQQTRLGQDPSLQSTANKAVNNKGLIFRRFLLSCLSA